MTTKTIGQSIRRSAWDLARREIGGVIQMIAESLQDVSDPVVFTVQAGAFSVVGIGIAMSAVATYAPPYFAALGMAAVFYISLPISVIYWLREWERKCTADKLDEIADLLADIGCDLNNKLEEIGRNVI